MGGELVSPASLFSYTEIFEAKCPFYMSIGMTYDEFWEDAADRVIAYRKAYILRQKRNNANAWAQGRYIYDALSAVVPALRGLSKEPVSPYLEEPYPITKEDMEDYERRQMEKQASEFRAYAQARNAERKAIEEAMKNADEHRPTAN